MIFLLWKLCLDSKMKELLFYISKPYWIKWV